MNLKSLQAERAELQKDAEAMDRVISMMEAREQHKATKAFHAKFRKGKDIHSSNGKGTGTGMKQQLLTALLNGPMTTDELRASDVGEIRGIGGLLRAGLVSREQLSAKNSRYTLTEAGRIDVNGDQPAAAETKKGKKPKRARVPGHLAPDTARILKALSKKKMKLEDLRKTVLADGGQSIRGISIAAFQGFVKKGRFVTITAKGKQALEKDQQ